MAIDNNTIQAKCFPLVPIRTSMEEQPNAIDMDTTVN